MQTKSVILKVRVTPAEAKHIRSIVKANSGTVSEFLRVCIHTALAQQGDPEAVKFLSALFEKGLMQSVERRVKAELERQRS